MIGFTVYACETGKVHWVGSCRPEDVELQVAGLSGRCVLAGVELKSGEYVDPNDGMPKLRPEMPVTQDGNTLTVPPNTEFQVIGPAETSGVTEDGVLEFEFSEPGTYTIKLSNFPYLDTEVILEG